jgi:hypothetical protein
MTGFRNDSGPGQRSARYRFQESPSPASEEKNFRRAKIFLEYQLH